MTKIYFMKHRYFSLLIIISIFNVLIHAQEEFTNNITARGDILVFGGKVLDSNNNPLTNVSVEIWQTDSAGIYNHKGDNKTNKRDSGFQFFGTSITDTNGNYIFRTVLPGKYEPRPRHIHVKLKQNNSVILITQIYFSIDGDTTGVGGSNINLKMDLLRVNNSKKLDYEGKFNFIVRSSKKGSLRLTDSQSEGPYYPLYDVSKYDNDLVYVEE